MKRVNFQSGSGAIDVLIAAAIIIFVILPVFSTVLEKYLIMNKAQIIKDAIDMANISAYNAIKADKLGRVNVDMELTRADEIYRRILADNLKLDINLNPLKDSLAEDKVQIKSIIFYSGLIQEVCPGGINIKRPSVHSTVIVPIRPSLFRSLILSLGGKQFIELEVHVDSEVPVNN